MGEPLGVYRMAYIVVWGNGRQDPRKCRGPAEPAERPLVRCRVALHAVQRIRADQWVRHRLSSISASSPEWAAVWTDIRREGRITRLIKRSVIAAILASGTVASIATQVSALGRHGGWSRGGPFSEGASSRHLPAACDSDAMVHRPAERVRRVLRSHRLAWRGGNLPSPLQRVIPVLSPRFGVARHCETNTVIVHEFVPV